MRKFIFKLFLALAPFLVCFSYCFYLAYRSGEAMPPSQVVRLQQSNPNVIYFPLSVETNVQYRLDAIRIKQPDILLLGSSRGRQWREQFFSSEHSFFNASLPSMQVHEQLTLVKYALELEKPPELIVLSLDQPNFLQDHFSNPNRFEPVLANPADDLTYMFNKTNRIVQELLDRKRTFDLLVSKETIIKGVEYNSNEHFYGLRAIRSGSGMRPDGSHMMPNRVPFEAKARRKASYQNMLKGIGPFKEGTNVAHTEMIEEILALAQRQNVMIVGLFPPYEPQVYNRMRTGGLHTYIPRATVAVSEVFEKYGYSCYDFSDPDSLEASSNEFYDGWHASEQVALRMAIKIFSEDNHALNQYASHNDLRHKLQTCNDPYRVYAPCILQATRLDRKQQR